MAQPYQRAGFSIWTWRTTAVPEDRPSAKHRAAVRWCLTSRAVNEPRESFPARMSTEVRQISVVRALLKLFVAVAVFVDGVPIYVIHLQVVHVSVAIFIPVGKRARIGDANVSIVNNR